MFLLSWKVAYKISDLAIATLLKFLAGSLTFIASKINCERLKAIALAVPRALYKLRVMMGLKRNEFEQYAKCKSIYKSVELLHTNSRGITKVKRCSYVRFPNHPHANERQPCGASLFKEVRTTTGSV